MAKIEIITLLAALTVGLGCAVGYLAGSESYAAAGGTGAALLISFGALVYTIIKHEGRRLGRVAADVENGKGGGWVSGFVQSTKHNSQEDVLEKEPRSSFQKREVRKEVRSVRDTAYEFAKSFESEALEWIEIAEHTSQVLDLVTKRLLNIDPSEGKLGLMVRTRSTRSNSLTRAGIPISQTKASSDDKFDETAPLPSLAKQRTMKADPGRIRSRQMSKILIDRALPIDQIMSPRERRHSESKSPKTTSVVMRSKTQRAITGLVTNKATTLSRTESMSKASLSGVVMTEDTKLKSKHWAEIMADYDAAVFVVSLMDYKDPARMQKAVKLFTKVYCSDKMAHMPVILILNKVDDFESSLEEDPLSNYYHFYSGGRSCFEGVEFIKQMFEYTTLKLPNRGFVYVVGSVTSDVSFQNMMKQIAGIGMQEGITTDMNFLVLGTTGSGKGSFCEQLLKHFSSLAGVKADVDAQEKEFKAVQIIEGSMATKGQWTELLGSVRCAIFVMSLEQTAPNDIAHACDLFRRVYFSPKLALVPLTLVLNRTPAFDRMVETRELELDITDEHTEGGDPSADAIVDYVRQRFETAVLSAGMSIETHVPSKRSFQIKIGSVEDETFIAELGTYVQSAHTLIPRGEGRSRTKTLILGTNKAGKREFSEKLTAFDKTIESTNMQEANAKESFEIVSVAEGALEKRAAWDLLVAHAKTSVFLVSMIEYRNPRKLEKTVDLFHRVFHSPKLAHIPTMVIFTMPDLCDGELKKKPLKSIFDDYTGPENYEGLLCFLEAKFRKASKSKPSFKTLTVVACNLKDDEAFKTMLRENLHKPLSGYFKQLELRKALVLGSKDSGKATFSKQLKKHAQGVVTDVATEQMQDQLFDVNEVKEESMAARRIWEHVIHGATSAVFLCPLTLYTDPAQLGRAVELFGKVCRSARLKEKHLVLLLTKLDMIERHMSEHPISTYWPKYNGPETLESLAKFITDKFTLASRGKNGEPRTFVVARGSLTEPDMFTSMIQQSLEVLIRKHRFQEQILKTIVLGPKQSGKSTFSRMLKTYYTNYEPECTSDLLTEVALNTDVVYSNKTASRNTWTSMIDKSHSAVFIVSLTDYVNPSGMFESVKLFSRVFHSKKLQSLPLILILSEVTNFADSIKSNPLNFFYSSLPQSSAISLQDSVTFIERMFQRECRMRSSSRIFRCECGDLQDMDSFKDIIDSSVELQKTGRSPNDKRVGVLVLGSDERGKKIFSDQIQSIYKQKTQTSSVEQQYEMVEPLEITDGELASRNVWERALSEVQLAVFITPLTNYVHLSDLEHSLELFHKVSTSSKLSHVSLVLILSELREFSRMIQKIPMKSLFDGFDGAGDLESSIEFMKMIFEPENREFICFTGDVDDKKDGARLMNETFGVKSDGKKVDNAFRKALILGPEHKAKTLFSEMLKGKIKDSQSATEEQQNDIADDGNLGSAEASYKRKWEEMISGVGNVLFIADVRHYSCPAKFYKSLKSFSTVCRSRKLLHARVTLVLTHLDRLRAHLTSYPLQDYLPACSHGANADTAVSFIRIMYESEALEGIDRTMTVAQGAFESEGAVRGLCNLIKSKSEGMKEFDKLLILGSDKPSVLEHFSETTRRVSNFDVVKIKADAVDSVIEVDAISDADSVKKPRKKWEDLINGLDLVFFVSPLTNYNHADDLETSVSMFASIFKSRKLHGLPIVLVLTKQDLFIDRFSPELMKKTFPEFRKSGDAATDVKEAQRMIVDMYKKAAFVKEMDRDFECICGTAISETGFNEMMKMSDTMCTLSKDRHTKLKALLLGPEGSGRDGFTTKIKKYFSHMKINAGSADDQKLLVEVDEIAVGSTADRSHWNEVVSSLSAVVFIASAVDYSDPEQMVNSMKLFNRVVNSEKLKNAKTILLMSKIDLMNGHIKSNPLIRYMSDYKGGSDADAAVDFIASKYREISSSKRVICAKSNLLDTGSFKNLITTTIGDDNTGGRVLVLGAKGVGKSTFSDQLKRANGKFSTEDTASSAQEQLLGVLEVKKGTRVARDVWSGMLNTSRVIYFVASLENVAAPERMQEALALFQKAYTSKKLATKPIMLLLTTQGDSTTAATQVEGGVEGAIDRFRSVVASHTERTFYALNGDINDDSFLEQIARHEVSQGLTSEAEGTLLIFGLDGSDKTELAALLKSKKKVEAAPIATRAEQEAMLMAQEIKEGDVGSRKSWNELIAGTRIGIFVVSLEACLEPSLCDKAIRMFEKICSSPKLETISLCLLLSKKDLLEKKIESSANGMRDFFNDEFPESSDAKSAQDAINFIIGKFNTICDNGGRNYTVAAGSIEDDDDFRRMCSETLDVASASLPTSETAKVLILGPHGAGKSALSEQLAKHKTRYASSDAINNEDLERAGLTMEEIDSGTTATKEAWNDKIRRTDAVLFLVSLPEYTNPDKFYQSLKLFARVYHSPKLARLPVVLVLNKDDAFISRIKTVPISSVFQDFTGPDDYENSLMFIRNKFEAVALQKGETREFRAVTSCFLQAWSFKSLVYQAIEEPLLKENLAVDFNSLNLLVLGSQGAGKSTFSRLMRSYFMTQNDTTSASVNEQQMLFEAFNIVEGQREKREHWEELVAKVKDALFVISLPKILTDDSYLDHTVSMFRKVYSSSKMEHVNLSVVLNGLEEFSGKFVAGGIEPTLPSALRLSGTPSADACLLAIDDLLRTDVGGVLRTESAFDVLRCDLTSEESLANVIAKTRSPEEADAGVNSKVTLVLGNDNDGKAILAARLKSLGAAVSTKVGSSD